MALPANLTLRTVKGQYLDIEGAYMTGSVEFSMDSVLSNPGASVVILPTTIIAPLDSEGKFSKAILTTDDPDVSPTGFRYKVTEKFNGVSGRPPFYLDVPGDSTDPIDLSTIVDSLPPSGGETLYVAITQKGAPLGVAPLDADSKVPAINLPPGSSGTVTSDGITDATSLGRQILTSATQVDTRSLIESQAAANISVADLIATTPFYVAHRGSGGEFPEHTRAAYESSVAAGVKAIEVSVHTTADGVPVCFHDTTLDRVTAETGPIEDWTYAALRENITVEVPGLLGQGWAPQQIPTLREVLDEFFGKVVIFLEAKSNPAVPKVQEMLATYPLANKSVVWKAHYLATTFSWAKDNGYETWAYLDFGTVDASLDAIDAVVDMWGVPHTETDTRIGQIVLRGKPVIVWEVHRRSERDRFVGLGVDGLMTSEYLYVTHDADTPIQTHDDWPTLIKAPGTLGQTNYSETGALKYTAIGEAYIDVVPNRAVLLGSFSDSVASNYTIRFEMKWDTIPGANLHSGIAFGKVSDDVYQFSAANASGGYHLVFRDSGQMQLYAHNPGVTSGVLLGEVATDTPVAGAWMTFEIVVSPTDVTVRRTDVEPDDEFTVVNNSYRGRYMHLSTGSASTLASQPYYRNFEVV